MIEIETLTLLRGHLPPRAFGLVVEWGSKHRDALRANWARASRNELLLPVEPLE